MMGLTSWEISEEWRVNGKCWIEKKDPNYFFVDGSEASKGCKGGLKVQDIADERKEYCKDCPVQSDCLNWALATHQEYGIFGGTTEQDRVRIRRRTASRLRRERGEPEPKAREHRPTKPKPMPEPIPYIPKCDRQEQAS